MEKKTQLWKWDIEKKTKISWLPWKTSSIGSSGRAEFSEKIDSHTICETFKISCLTGSHLAKGDLENLSKDQEFHLIRWLNVTQSLRKTSQDSTNLAGKFHLEYSSDTPCTREEFGKETFRSWTLRVGKDGRIRNPRKKIQCEIGDSAQNLWNKSYSRSQMEN